MAQTVRKIALDAATLAALETINAVISDGGATISVDDGAGTITVDGTVELGATALAALETVNAIVSGEVSLSAGSLAALETIELGGTSLAALESISVTGPVTDTELRASPLPVSGTVTASGPLTDAQLAARLPLSVEQATSVDVADGGGSLTVDGSVTVGAALPAGTNNIGDVDVLTLPALPAGTNNIGDVDVLTLPALAAGSANIGSVNVAAQPTVTTPTVTNVAASTSNVTLLSSNANRKGLYIQNDGTGILYVKLGTTAVIATSYTVKMVAGAFWELPGTPLYTGRVDAIWSATGGNGAMVTELTA